MGKRKTEARQCSRRLKGIYFVDPDDEDYNELLKNARRNLEILVAPTMPCKRQPSMTKVGAKPEVESEKNSKTMNRRKGITRVHKTTSRIFTVRKGCNSMTHYNLVHKVIPMPQAMKIPDAKAAVDKKWKKLETIPAWELEKVKSKKRDFSGSTKRPNTKLLH